MTIVVLVVCWAPIWFMLVVASHDSSAATRFPPPALPGGSLPENVATLLSALALGHALVNSVIVSASIAVGGSLVCALAGFAFAKLRFPGRAPLFAVLLIGLTLPVQLAVIPNYLLMSALGWVDSLTALIVPGLASAFGVFWMRQHIATALSDEVLDAAALDGCGPWRIFRFVAFPVVRPGAAVLAGLLFVASWSDFMWPFIVLRSPSAQTVQVALRGLQGEYGIDYSLVFTGALLATAPMLLLLLITGRWALRAPDRSSDGPPRAAPRRRRAERPTLRSSG